MSQNLSKELPRNIWIHSTEIQEVLGQYLGVIDAELKFDKFFLLGTITNRLTKLIIALKEAGTMNKSRVGFLKENRIIIDEKVLAKMQFLWTGNTYLVIDKNQRHPEQWESSEVWLRQPKPYELKFNQESIMLPALKHLNPMNDIHGISMLVHIRETVPVKYGLRDVDVTQLSLSGGFVYNFADSIVPIFKNREEILNSKARSYWVGRAFYYSVINILTEIYMNNFSKFYAQTHLLLNQLNFGDGSSYQKEKVSDTTELW